jgi:acyl-CoA synthetase (AMP-forming)/AMP-acid ligase II
MDTDLVDTALADTWSPPPIDSDCVAYLQYSSGFTGDPKGVMITHRNALHNLGLITDLLQVHEDMLGCFWLPMFHDMGLVSGGLMPVAAGGDVTLMAPTTFLQRPHLWLAELSRPKLRECRSQLRLRPLCRHACHRLERRRLGGRQGNQCR